jgi:formamidopyrimidine-DNA glycosylase
MRRCLNQRLEGHHVVAFEVASPRLFGGIPRAAVVDLFLGKPFLGAQRKGRSLLLRLGDAGLGLGVWGTARATLTAVTPEGSVLRAGDAAPPGAHAVPPRGSRLAITLAASGQNVPTWRLWYGDLHETGAGRPRPEAQLYAPGELLREMAPAGEPSGIDPLDPAFTLIYFKRMLKRKKRTIFQLLVDDELIAGIGNQYADEILFAAKLRPVRPVSSLVETEIRRLYYSILETLQKAIRFGGILEEEPPLFDGLKGTFHRFLTVHGREAQACPACQARLAGARVRTTESIVACYCPRCQR